MNTVLLIPDGVGVRNFVLGQLLEKLQQQGRVTVVHDFPEGLVEGMAWNRAMEVGWRSFPTYHEDLLTFELRQALLFSHLFWGKSFAMKHVLRRSRPAGSWRRRAALGSAMLLGRLAATQRGIETLDRRHETRVRRSAAASEAAQVLKELEADVVFCSNQRAHIVGPFVAAARAAGIPTVTFIFSWDNLTSKGRMGARFDYFLVWSDLMRSQLMRFYPRVTSDRVHVVGTPQFDPYVDQGLLWSREEFCERVGADPSRPIICYSGGDVLGSPDDPAYVEILAELIERGEIKGRPQLLVRPTPVDNGHRYRSVLQRHQSIVFSQPAWQHPEGDEWSCVLPTAADTVLLANTIYHSAVNVNVASTMTLDFAIMDRPVVNIAFDVVQPPRWGQPIDEYLYQFEHYRSVVEMGAVRLARSPHELRDHLNTYLEDPSLERPERHKLVDLQVSPPIGKSSCRVVEALQRIVAK